MDTILERGMVVFLDTSVNREQGTANLQSCRVFKYLNYGREEQGPFRILSESWSSRAGCDVLCHDMT